MPRRGLFLRSSQRINTGTNRLCATVSNGCVHTNTLQTTPLLHHLPHHIPHHPTTLVYDAVMSQGLAACNAWAALGDEATSADRLQYLRDLTFLGPSGTVVFEDNGNRDPVTGYYILQNVVLDEVGRVAVVSLSLSWAIRSTSCAWPICSLSGASASQFSFGRPSSATRISDFF